MRALSASEMLNICELAQARTAAERALILLAAASPDESWESLGALGIGERDARLLTIREWTFGPQIDGVTECPACAARLELSLDASEVRGGGPASAAEPGTTYSLSFADYDVSFRLPTSLDLFALGRGCDIEAGRTILLQRCVVKIHRRGEEYPASDLPPEVSVIIAARMAQADPRGDIELLVACPSCGYQWKTLFDIVSFFWGELMAWAQRIIREVHVLASTYGWREADILNMSAWRRQTYLNLVGE